MNAGAHGEAHSGLHLAPSGLVAFHNCHFASGANVKGFDDESDSKESSAPKYC